MPNPSIKNERVYRALRRRGYDKSKAAAISNAQKAMRTKAANFSASVGQTIVGNLARGGGGRFSASDDRQQGPKLSPAASSALALLASGKRPAVGMDELVRAGLAERFEDGSYSLTDAGRTAARVPAKATGRSQERRDGQRRESDKPKRSTGRTTRQETREQARAQASEERSQQIAERLRSRYGNRAAAKSLTVFKDTSGSWRWLSVTTTAFQDRDGEIISRAALKADVERRDRDGMHGPLRYWHVGMPDARNTAAPWGPGADIGWCDFAALSASGLSLIESGTFKSEAIARKIAAVSDRLEMSPGFFHPAARQDARTYDSIRIFERSIVPSWAGRASNLFTSFTTTAKGERMDATKRQAMKAIGLPDDLIDNVLTETDRREKAAQDQGVALKSEQEPRRMSLDGQEFVMVPAADWDAALADAAPPAAETEPAAEPADQPTGKSTQLLGEMTGAEFAALLAAALAPAQTTKAQEPPAEVAALKSEIDTLKALMAELRGEQPPAVQRGGYRASQDAKTVIKEQAQKQAGPLAGIVAMIDSTIPGGSN